MPVTDESNPSTQLGERGLSTTKRSGNIRSLMFADRLATTGVVH